MNGIRILLLGAVVALAMLAPGAGTASATELCSTNTSPCMGTKYEAGKEIFGQMKAGTEAVFTIGATTVGCRLTTFKFKTSTAGGVGKPVSAKLEWLTFGEC